MRTLRGFTVLATVVALLGLVACEPYPSKVDAHGSVGQIWIGRAEPNVPMQVVDAAGRVVPSIDQAGNTVTKRVPPMRRAR